MFLLDTNVVSELRKFGLGKTDPNFARWVASQNAAHFYISVITLQELEFGILRVERRGPDEGTQLRRWLTQRVLPEFTHRTLLVDAAVALRCASLHVPKKRPALDALIAATALVNNLTLVTRNLTDFENTGLTLINPWMPLVM